MKKLIYILLVSFLASCENVEVAPGLSAKDNKSFAENPEENEIELNYEDDSPARGEGVEVYSQPLGSGPYSNPFFIYGTDFGNFFQTMYIHGRYDQMIEFTSSESIDKFGKNAILDFYKNELDFGYDIGKYPLSSGTDGDITVINYEANIMATKKIVRVSVVLENDSCKIVLPNKLKNFPS
jgi:hypothetical protein